MASIDRRRDGYRVRYRDPLGNQRSRQFKRKVDAERFAREVEVDKDRGSWVDPRGGDIPLAEWQWGRAPRGTHGSLLDDLDGGYEPHEDTQRLLAELVAKRLSA